MEMYRKLNIAYLRKSREDAEAEKRGEGETLARHQALLDDTAKRLGLHIDRYYKEVVSGETIAARPMMKQLLRDVESGLCANVLVVEVERLARGDSLDQGTVSRAFFLSGTQIVTPTKTYDPDNEFDEEYFEFSLFMSRREYKAIRRRMQRGRQSSVKEGKYCGSVSPYGYNRVKLKNEKGYSLEVNPDEAPAVKLIFEWYAHGYPGPDGCRRQIGTTMIARHLDELGYKPRKTDTWRPTAIASILQNPTYIGKTVWNRRKNVKSVKDNVVSISRPRSDPDLYEGRHPALVDESTFDIVQERYSQHEKRHYLLTVRCPLAGILICSKCGHTIKYRPAGNRSKGSTLYYDTMICNTPGCTTVSSPLALVEQRLIETMEKWLKDYELDYPMQYGTDDYLSSREAAFKNYQQEFDGLIQQRDKIYNLFERGTYDEMTFHLRIDTVNKSIETCKTELEKAEKDIMKYNDMKRSREIFIPKVKHVLELYSELDDPADKNALLKEVLEKVIYTKDKGGRFSGYADKFELVLYPKLPESV